MEKNNHKSQFRYHGEDADDLPLRIKPRDRSIFALLHPQLGYERLPSNWIHAFVGGDPKRLSHRLARLARERKTGTTTEAPYLVRSQDWYKHAVYSRAPHADRELGEEPAYSKDPFSHSVLQNIVAASIELGVRDDETIKMLKWHDLVHRIPKATLELPDPHRIPLADSHYKGDIKPFKLIRGRESLFVMSAEIDRATEPLIGPNKRRSIMEKFRHLKEIYDSKIWHQHYDQGNSIVLFVTIDEHRMRSMMEVCRKVYGGPCTHILFAYTEDWANAHSYPKPPLDFYSRAWKRVGYPDFYLNKFEEM